MKSINEQISPEFVIQARKLAEYTRLLHQILPIECRNHVEVANIRNQNLMLITDSPVWTTKLRQLCPQILQFIQENSADTDTSQVNRQVNRQENKQTIHHVQIRTRYNPVGSEQEHASKTAKKPVPRISQNTAKLLSQSANSFDDEPLKMALLKVAKHVNTKTPSDK